MPGQPITHRVFCNPVCSGIAYLSQAVLKPKLRAAGSFPPAPAWHELFLPLGWLLWDKLLERLIAIWMVFLTRNCGNGGCACNGYMFVFVPFKAVSWLIGFQENMVFLRFSATRLSSLVFACQFSVKPIPINSVHLTFGSSHWWHPLFLPEFSRRQQIEWVCLGPQMQRCSSFHVSRAML